MGECDGVGAVHGEVAVSRGVYSARVAAQAALGSRGVFPNPSFIRLRKSCPSPTSDRQVTITLHSLHGLDFPC